MALCKECETEVIWIKTPNGKNMILDAKETTVYIKLINPLQWVQVRGHVPHWATCPNAKDFKKE